MKVPAYIALPAALTAPVAVPQIGAHPTNGDLLELCVQRGFALDQANRQLSAIRKLQPKEGQ